MHDQPSKKIVDIRDYPRRSRADDASPRAETAIARFVDHCATEFFSLVCLECLHRFDRELPLKFRVGDLDCPSPKCQAFGTIIKQN